jgi:hypothetical protein
MPKIFSGFSIRGGEACTGLPEENQASSGTENAA